VCLCASVGVRVYEIECEKCTDNINVFERERDRDCVCNARTAEVLFYLIFLLQLIIQVSLAIRGG
jgi:hypothetical protein